MKQLQIGKSDLHGSEIILGCMRISEMEENEVDNLVHTALDNGINYFDHADIYGAGKSEEVFSRVLAKNPELRRQMIIQSKCGIRKGFFDFSKEHILQSVDGSLKRLGTEYLDVLLLHRPDTLMEPEEVADAFSILQKSGKVRHFGVSNQRPATIALLQQYLEQRILINQLQFSPTNTGMIDASLNVNMANAASVEHDGGVLEYCRSQNITIQTWSPFQFGYFEGVYLNNPQFSKLNAKINELAEKYNLTNSAIVAAWILRHPAKMQMIIGTTSAERLRTICKASEVTISREEWYEVYRAAGNELP